MKAYTILQCNMLLIIEHIEFCIGERLSLYIDTFKLEIIRNDPITDTLYVHGCYILCLIIGFN